MCFVCFDKYNNFFLFSMLKKKFKTYKKILYAGNGDPIEFKTDTKAIFHFEVFLPKINVDINNFPQEKFAIF